MDSFSKKYSFADVLLVPQKSILRSRSDADLTTNLTSKIKLKLPIISANMDTVTESRMALAIGKLGGVGVIHRFLNPQSQAKEVSKVKRENILVGGAVGIKEEDIDRARLLLEAGCDFLVVDIAHGHSHQLGNFVGNLKKKFPRVELIAGNIATSQGVHFLAKLGVSGIKVGIGPGSACTTRIVTGFGVPQLSAILDCAEAVKKYGLPVIADGGIDSSGALVKALAAGASTVMLGNLLAGCDESPGKTVVKEGQKFKLYRGMASTEATRDRFQKSVWDPSSYKSVSEGVAGLVSYKGPVSEVVGKLMGGLRSGISYGGAKDIPGLQKNAEFIEITPAGWRESLPHDLLSL